MAVHKICGAPASYACAEATVHLPFVYQEQQQNIMNLLCFGAASYCTVADTASSCCVQHLSCSFASPIGQILSETASAPSDECVGPILSVMC